MERLLIPPARFQWSALPAAGFREAQEMVVAHITRVGLHSLHYSKSTDPVAADPFLFVNRQRERQIDAMMVAKPAVS